MKIITAKQKVITTLKAVLKAFFVIGSWVLRNLDDLCIIGGIGCLSAGGFIFHTIAGLGVLGSGLIGFGFLVAKGGGVNASKKRAD